MGEEVGLVVSLIVISVLWIAPPIMGIVHARKKGRNIGVWAAICIVLGWIGFLTLISLQSLKECEFCCKKIPKNASLCIHCKKEQKLNFSSSDNNTNKYPSNDRSSK